MAEVQRLKELPEECLLNIASYLLGTPQQLKLKNSKGLKQIQDKCKFGEKKRKDRIEFRRVRFFSDQEDPDEKYKIERYGYIINDRNYSIEKALRIMKGQCDRLLEMTLPYGNNNLEIHFCFYDDEGDDDFLSLHIDSLDYLSVDDMLEKMDKWILKYDHTLNGLIRFNSIRFHFTNKVIHFDETE